MQPPRTLLIFLGPALLAALAGCGAGGPRIVKVSGTLTYKGKPVPNAFIHFHPENGRPSWAYTDENGKFAKASYDEKRDGVVAGKHKVYIDAGGPSAGSEPGMAPKTSSADLREMFNKYNQTNSKLELTIDKAQDLEIKLD